MIDFIIALMAVVVVALVIARKIKNCKTQKGTCQCSLECRSCGKRCW